MSGTFDFDEFTLADVGGDLYDNVMDIFYDDNGDFDWNAVATTAAGAYGVYTAITAYKTAKEAGNAAEESLALEKLLAITNKDLALAGFELQKEAFYASLAIEAKKMGYWEAAQTLNKKIVETKFNWYKKLQPFALDKEKYDQALRDNNLEVLDEQTKHVRDMLSSNTDDLDSVYKDQSQLYTDQRTALDSYETRVLDAIAQIGERDVISNEDIMRDYGQLYEQNIGELNNLIDRVNTRGYSDNYANGMNRSTLEDDRSRDLTKKYYSEILKTKNASYDQAINRARQKDTLFDQNRTGILNEAGNTSILDAHIKAISSGNTVFSNANTIVGRDYDYVNAQNQLRNGGMVSSGSGNTATMNTAAGSGTTYNGNTASLLSNAASGANNITSTYAEAAAANAKTSAKAAADAFDLLINNTNKKDED